MIVITDTTLALSWSAALLLLIGLSAADAVRELFPRRRDLLSRLALVRLHAMLGRRHIPIPVYLRRTPARQVAAHIRTCELCPAKALCDAALQGCGAEDFAFCPSNRDLAALAP